MEKSNEKALTILGQQYSGLMNQTENWEFFRGLAEYVKTVESLTQTKGFIEALQKQSEISRKVYEQFNSRAFQELAWSGARMAEIAEKFAKQYEPIMKAVQEMQKHINGTILSTNRLQSIEHSIFDVARKFKESGLADAIKKFEDNQRRIQNIYGNYTFSQAYEKLPEEKEKLERIEQIEPWGAWQNLPLVKQVVYEPDEVIEEVKEKAETDPNQKWLLFNLKGVVGEMEAIRTGKASDEDVVFFKVKEYKSYLQRFHNYITAELLKLSDVPSVLAFNPVSSILNFQGREILIAKSKNTDPHYLLQTLFIK